MLQKPASVPLFCQNLTKAVLFYQVLQNIFSTNFKKEVQNSAARLVFKSRKHEHTKPVLQKNPVLQFFYWKLPSLSFWTPDCLPSIQTTSLNFWHQEPYAYLSQKQRPLDNELFLSRVRHSGTHYCMMFVNLHQHLRSSKPWKLISSKPAYN